MKRFALRVVFTLLLVMTSITAFAAPDPGVGVGGDKSTDGLVGEALSRQLYCDAKGLIQGDVGLLVGLIIAFMAIWSLVRGGKMIPSVITLIFGVLITALPSLIESGFLGLSNLLEQSNIVAANVIYAAPDCSAHGDEVEKAYQNQKTNDAKGRPICSGYTDCAG